MEIMVWKDGTHHAQGHQGDTGREEADQDGDDGSALQFLQGLIS
mgnify:CR=1 FL=1